MKIAITIYPDDFAEADRIIHQLRGVRSLELDGYMGKASYDKNFDKQRTSFAGSGDQTPAASSEDNPGHPETKTSTDAPASRPNISPGEPSISKIGSNTKDDILLLLKGSPDQPPLKYAEHLKLLWKRGEVKFDGKEYYL